MVSPTVPLRTAVLNGSWGMMTFISIRMACLADQERVARELDHRGRFSSFRVGISTPECLRCCGNIRILNRVATTRLGLTPLSFKSEMWRHELGFFRGIVP